METKNACKNIYFEIQDDGASCGRHALNNLYGGSYFTACKGDKNFANANAYENKEIEQFQKSYKNINKLKNNKPKINLTKIAKFFHTTDNNSRSNEPLVKENYPLTLIKKVLELIGGYTLLKVIINYDKKGNPLEGVYTIHGVQISFNLSDYFSNSNNELGYLIANGGHYSVVKKCGDKLILLDSIKDLVATIEAEIEEDDNDDDLSDDLSNDYDDADDTINYDSDTSFTEEERKKINGPEHYAFLKRYSLVPK